MRNKLMQMIGLAMSLGLAGVALARDFPGVESLMSKDEFVATGLDKLSPAELKALDNWLMKYTKDDVPELVKDVPELRESVALKQAMATEPKTNEPIVSRIKGDFEGWTGKTLFKLENGQVWKQRQTGRYRRKMTNPEVRISKNLLGFYMMEIKETGRRVGVKRVR